MASVNQPNNKPTREVPMKLHGYFRSSASYRVRIALNLKGLSTQHLPHHLRKGEQCAPAYLAHQPAGAGADAGKRGRRHPHPVARHHRMAGRDPPRAAALAKGSAAPRQSAGVCPGARLRHPPGAESESAGAAAAAQAAGGAGDGVGGLGQPRRAGSLRNPDRGRDRSILFRRQADHRRSLPGAAARQCQALRRRRVGLSAAAEGRSRGTKP